MKLVVGQRQGIHGALRLDVWLGASTLVLRQSSESRVAVQGVWTWDLIGHTRDVGSVVVAMARLVVTVCKDGQMAFRVGASQFGFGTGVVESLAGSIHLEIKVILFGAAQAFSTRVALASVVVG